MKEPMRYMANAKETLTKSAIEDGYYADIKYVKSACGVAYLGVLEAVNESLIAKGYSRKELPKKVEEYEKAIKKHFVSAGDGKMLKQFSNLYDQLHIAGYYRGLLHNAAAIKAILRDAEDFIKKLR